MALKGERSVSGTDIRCLPLSTHALLQVFWHVMSCVPLKSTVLTATEVLQCGSCNRFAVPCAPIAAKLTPDLMQHLPLYACKVKASDTIKVPSV